MTKAARRRRRRRQWNRGRFKAVISRTLHGQRTPTLDAIVRLSLTLNVSADYLLGLKASPQGDYRDASQGGAGA